MERVVCFGDSNTYGYDPRSFLGERYPEEIRWTGRLARMTGWAVADLGCNGREIPAHPPAELLTALDGADALTVMLGSNDLLQHPERTAWEIAAQMGTFLTQLPAVPLLLIAPPPMQRGLWVREERLLEGSAQLGTALAGLAKDLGVSFADAADWDIPLAFDGVHFTEEGHRRFAAGVEPALCAVRGA